MKFTIKLGKPGRSITELLKKDHGLIGPIENWDGIAGSALYYGQAYESSPQWKAFIEDGAGQIFGYSGDIDRLVAERQGK